MLAGVRLFSQDKAGKSTGRFYRTLIRRADDRFDAWLRSREVMAASLEDELARLPGERRAKVDARAALLIAEEMTLRDLRHALDRTQVRLARELGVKQETVSRLEKRSDMLLSTLRGYVEAMGGELDLLAKFPDRPPVRLKTLASVLPHREPAAGKPAPATRPRTRARKPAEAAA